MNFYTSLFTGTLVFLVITLIIIGFCMVITKKSQTYPPSVADCPDYYSLDVDGVCKIGSNIYSNDISDVSCNVQDFSKPLYLGKGIGIDSGMCNKKLWANKCGVSWDGITTNDNICYQEYNKPT
jgi:hypothetical protein